LFGIIKWLIKKFLGRSFMVSGILGVIGLIIGIVKYSTSEASVGLPFLYMFLGAGAGGLVGAVVDLIAKLIQGGKSKTPIFVIFFIVTAVCLVFTFFAFLENANDVLNPLKQIGEGRVMYGLVNMILYPFVVFIGSAAGFAEVTKMLPIAYIVALCYGVIFAFIFVYSDLASTADDHRGKYKVKVDKDGYEVSDRIPLDAYTEALKENALIIVIMLVVTLFCPFLAYAVGLVFCFWKQFEKIHISIPIIIGAVLTILPYVLLFVLS
jgi:hypothetical protein